MYRFKSYNKSIKIFGLVPEMALLESLKMMPEVHLKRHCKLQENSASNGACNQRL